MRPPFYTEKYLRNYYGGSLFKNYTIEAKEGSVLQRPDDVGDDYLSCDNRGYFCCHIAPVQEHGK
jgi:hypothetical protein